MDHRIIVKNLPASINRIALVQMFCTFVKVDKIKFSKQFGDKSSQQCVAFFPCEQDATRFSTKLAHVRIGERELEARPVESNECLLHVRKWPSDLGVHELERVFVKFGEIGMVRVLVSQEEPTSAQEQNGFVVEYMDPIDATIAFMCLNGKPFMFDGTVHTFDLKLVGSENAGETEMCTMVIMGSAVQEVQILEWFSEYELIGYDIDADDSGHITRIIIRFCTIEEAKAALVVLQERKIAASLECSCEIVFGPETA